MSTNRRPLKLVANATVTEGQLDLWRRLRRITAIGAENEREPEGRGAEFHSALRHFEFLLGGIDHDPASFPAIHATSSEPPSWMTSPAQIEDYERAHEIFNLFERLTAEDDARRQSAAEDAPVYRKAEDLRLQPRATEEAADQRSSEQRKDKGWTGAGRQ
jgi:hypothetical protein